MMTTLYMTVDHYDWNPGRFSIGRQVMVQDHVTWTPSTVFDAKDLALFFGLNGHSNKPVNRCANCDDYSPGKYVCDSCKANTWNEPCSVCQSPTSVAFSALCDECQHDLDMEAARHAALAPTFHKLHHEYQRGLISCAEYIDRLSTAFYDRLLDETGSDEL